MWFFLYLSLSKPFELDSSTAFTDSYSSRLNWRPRDKPNSVGFLCRVQLAHSLQRMLLLVEPPPTSWVYLEHHGLSHGDTQSLRLSPQLQCLLAILITMALFPQLGRSCHCLMQVAHLANEEEFGNSLYLGPVLVLLPYHVLCRTPGSQLHSGRWWKGFLYFYFRSIYCWSYVSTNLSVCSRDSILLSCFASVKISAKTKKKNKC